MSRLGSRGITVVALSLVLICLGCGGSGISTAPSPVVTPGIVTLSPANDVSVEIGNTLSFTSAAQDANGTALTPSPLITFVSSNPSVVQVAASGLACAGKWDSLTIPQICTPGPVGTAVVTAISAGVSSPPATVHVHQHIDSIAISPVVTPTPTPACVSKGQTLDYQVLAFNQGIDITSTVGPFNWSSFNQTVATVNSTLSALLPGQARVTAVTPGMTTIFTSISGVTSPPVQFITCPVMSISLAVENTNLTSFIVANGSRNITATVTDSSNTQITQNLTWSTSDAAAFTASGTSTGTAGSTKAGSATIIASCLPPFCNVGFPTPKVIYPENVITATATGTGGTVTAPTIFLASRECGVRDSVTQVVTNSDDCISIVAPIDTTTNTLGVGVDLPTIPNSVQFNRQGTSLYLGTDSGRLGAVGLSVVTPAATTQVAPALVPVPAAPGKILAVSSDGTSIIVSDTVDTPNQVFVVVGTAVSASLPITGATAASFAPNNSKAFIVAGTNLYVYSATEALKKISLASPANDVTFLADGAFAYVSSGSPSTQVTVFKTCDNRPALDDGGFPEDVTLGSSPLFLKASPDNTKIFSFNTSGIDFIDVTTMGKPTPSFPVTATAAGCESPAPSATPPLKGGLPTVINQHQNTGASFNFGQGNFTPTQLIFHSSGSRAYILASDLSIIVVFNFDTQSTSTIQLSGNSVPIQASLSTDGKTLYVLGRDLTTKVNSVHFVDTTTNADLSQIVISTGLCHPRVGLSTTFTCDPDLIAVKP